MDVAKITLEFLKSLFRVAGRGRHRRAGIHRVSKVNAGNVSVEVGQQLLSEAKPTQQIETTSKEISLSVFKSV